MPSQWERLRLVGIGLMMTLIAYLAFAGYFLLRILAPADGQFWLLTLFVVAAPAGRVLALRIPDAKARRVAILASLCDVLFASSIMLIAGQVPIPELESTVAMVGLPYLAAVLSGCFCQQLIREYGDPTSTLASPVFLVVSAVCPLAVLTNSPFLCSIGVESLAGTVVVYCVGGLLALFRCMKPTELTA